MCGGANQQSPDPWSSRQLDQRELLTAVINETGLATCHGLDPNTDIEQLTGGRVMVDRVDERVLDGQAEMPLQLRQRATPAVDAVLAEEAGEKEAPPFDGVLCADTQLCHRMMRDPMFWRKVEKLASSYAIIIAPQPDAAAALADSEFVVDSAKTAALRFTLDVQATVMRRIS